jgi:hypothetical protein
MVATESKPITGNTEKTVIKQVKMTRGEIMRFNRARWFFMKKHFPFTDTQLAALRIASCPAKINGSEVTLVCYFNPASAEEKGLTIEDFETLNKHPELILFEGYEVNGKKDETIIQKRNSETSLLEEKIKKGEITEVGVVSGNLTTQNLLNRLGSFMLMGGFVIIIVLVIIIVVAIAILTK